MYNATHAPGTSAGASLISDRFLATVLWSLAQHTLDRWQAPSSMTLTIDCLPPLLWSVGLSSTMKSYFLMSEPNRLDFPRGEQTMAAINNYGYNKRFEYNSTSILLVHSAPGL
jgi:hypothetical protein